jgi:NAD+ kinase
MALMKKKKIKLISIKLKPTKIENIESIVSNLIRWLTRKSIQVQFLINEQKRLEKECSKKILKMTSFVNEKDFYEGPDLLISLGGDGTLIGASHLTNKLIPIFGINLGRLGFITEFNRTNFFNDLESVINGKFQTRKIYLFNVKVIDKKKKVLHNGNFLNDVVINKNDIARMFKLKIECNDEDIYNLSGDGLIVASPLGSTAYSLAAGGPIINPDVKAMILTPICPHSLTYRPLAIPDTSKLKVGLLDRYETVTVTLDGQHAFQFSYGQQVSITKSKSKYITIIKNEERNYFQVLKEKFFHGR